MFSAIATGCAAGAGSSAIGMIVSVSGTAGSVSPSADAVSVESATTATESGAWVKKLRLFQNIMPMIRSASTMAVAIHTAFSADAFVVFAVYGFYCFGGIEATVFFLLRLFGRGAVFGLRHILYGFVRFVFLY